MIYDKSNPKLAAVLLAAITTLMIFIHALPVLGHGGKTHGDTNFSSLQAVQKATQLYDRLITSGKLSEDWETGLNSIRISTRPSNGKNEYVVQFLRTQGDPGSVYFFFDQKGEYSGSNFTGK